LTFSKVDRIGAFLVLQKLRKHPFLPSCDRHGCFQIWVFVRVSHLSVFIACNLLLMNESGIYKQKEKKKKKKTFSPGELIVRSLNRPGMLLE